MPTPVVDVRYNCGRLQNELVTSIARGECAEACLCIDLKAVRVASIDHHIACGRSTLRENTRRPTGDRVIRLMQEDGLRGRVPKRFKSTTMSDHDDPIAANLLDRQFVAEAPNQRWVGDTTEFVIGGSQKLYLAAVLDLYSRLIVGGALSAVNDRRLTIKALEDALHRRCPGVGLLHHSDRGCTLGFKRSSQRVRVSLSLNDFAGPLQAFSSRVFSAADC